MIECKSHKNPIEGNNQEYKVEGDGEQKFCWVKLGQHEAGFREFCEFISIFLQ